MTKELSDEIVVHDLKFIVDCPYCGKSNIHIAPVSNYIGLGSISTDTFTFCLNCKRQFVYEIIFKRRKIDCEYNSEIDKKEKELKKE